MGLTPGLYVVTAPRGAGKTTYCRALAEQARQSGQRVAGLVSPAIFEGGVKTGILAQDLGSGQSRQLAMTRPVDGVASPGFDTTLGKWLFASSVIAWGNQVLETCLPSDLFIVDELGPLELWRGEGWAHAIAALRSGQYKTGVAVVRPECVDAFAQLGLPFQQINQFPQV